MGSVGRSSPFFASLLLLVSMTSLTVGASLAKGLFPLFGAAGITFLRLGIAALILVLVRRPWRIRMRRDQWRWIALYGATLGLMNLFFYFSIERLPIGLAIAIEFLGPLSVALFLSRHWKDLLWAFLALAGVVLILPRFEASASLDLVGVLFALAAAVAWAAYILIGKRVGEIVPSGQATAYGMMIGCLLTAPLGVGPALKLIDHPTAVLAAVGVGLLSSAIPYTLELWALKSLESKTFGILLSAEPAIGALSAFVLLNERLSLPQMAAVFFVIAASVGSTASGRRPPKGDTLNKITV